jgi:response regulator RpfG family c-di-GMP phosphodiesterase
MYKKPVIVMVDDEEADRMLLKIAMDDIGFKARVIEYENGTDFIEFVKTKCQEITPDFVILDLEMPKINGMQVLEYLQDNAELCDVPIIVFACSSDAKKVDKTHVLGAIKYVVKPHNLKGYADLAKFMMKNIGNQKKIKS